MDFKIFLTIHLKQKVFCYGLRHKLKDLFKVGFSFCFDASVPLLRGRRFFVLIFLSLLRTLR